MRAIKLAEERVLGPLLAARARKYGDETFLLFRDRKISFAELDRMSGRMAAGLRGLGIGRGDKVGLMLPNCPEFIALWFGLAYIGAVEVPINTHHLGDLLVYLLNFSDTRVLVADAQFLPQVAAIRDRLTTLEAVVVRRAPGDLTLVPELGGLPVHVLEAWDELVPLEPDPNVGPGDPYCMGFTSGTTGPSKGAMLPHNYAIYAAELVAYHADYTREEVIYSFLPLFHGNAQVLATLPALVSGCRLALGEKFSAGGFWDEIRRYKATSTNMIGGLVSILVKQPERPEDGDSSLRRVFGAAVKGTVWDAFEARFKAKLIEGYGMTESSIVLMNHVNSARKGSVGVPTPGFRVEIHDQDDQPVGPDVVGEIVTRPEGPYRMMTEYYKMPEKTLEAFRNLWFHTGDLGYYDADGYFYFVDRAKDAIRRLGENISSQELERIINEHPSVLESAAVGIPSELGEEEVKVLIVLRPGESLEPPELIEFCRQRMAKFMVPRYVEFRPALPKTPTDRVQKYQLKQEGLTPDTWDRLAYEGARADRGVRVDAS